MRAYIVLSQINIGQLVIEVNRRVTDGYVPQGGVVATGSCFLQAMYKAPAVFTVSSGMIAAPIFTARERIKTEVLARLTEVYLSLFNKLPEQPFNGSTNVFSMLTDASSLVRELEALLRQSYEMATNHFIVAGTTVDEVVEYIYCNREDE